MTGSQIVFYILAVLVVGGAIGVITRRNAVHSAILLIGTLMSVAGIYVLLEAEFLAAVQVLVYAGGVMVLFLFVILLVDLEQRGRKDAAPRKPVSRAAIAIGALATGLLLVAMLAVFLRQSLGEASGATEALRAHGGNLGAVSMSLFRWYVLPFELASVLLLVAMIGAVVLARFKS